MGGMKLPISAIKLSVTGFCRQLVVVSGVETTADCVDNDSIDPEVWHCPYGFRRSRIPLGERTMP